ncbi:hypothetical protein QL982_11900, partial [Psychrobacter sp. 5A.1]|uniref:hypothetical protein n=1 Tax=Psychrobacter sp. 5A.1 TaxID=3035207 RepID=UPI0025B4AAA8
GWMENNLPKLFYDMGCTSFIVDRLYHHPHIQMANLIAILGKDIVESWMKNKWLEFILMPDIYKLNFDNSYIDKSTSEFSERTTGPIKNIRPKINMY